MYRKAVAKFNIVLVFKQLWSCFSDISLVFARSCSHRNELLVHRFLVLNLHSKSLFVPSRSHSKKKYAVTKPDSF